MKILSTTLLLLGLSTAACAQSTPFDMTPEGASPAAKVATSPVPVAPVAPETAPLRRYVLQSPTLRLQGENPLKGWTFIATPEQASSEATFDLGYRNAIVVAPEASRLTVVVNETPIIAQELRGGEFNQHLAVKLPAGILKPGVNRVRFQVEQRHRTDCTQESTYDLWTDIDAAQTYFSFQSPAAGTFARLEDLAAIGPDTEGRSHFRIVAPSFAGREAAPVLLKLAQGLSLASASPNLSFSIASTLPATSSAGEIVVIVGTPDDLAGLNLPSNSKPLSITPFKDGSALVVSATDWHGIEAAIESLLAASASRKSDGAAFQTSRWRMTDTPMVERGGKLTLAELGVPSEEFFGRRFSTEFSVGLPGDFYANNYGTATLMLDAAYAQSVLPGSNLNVIVNGNLATTMPITSAGGAVLKQYPIRITMRHFRPGVNTIAFEGLLKTAEDIVCAPGATMEHKSRFALFNTSELVIPPFAKLSLGPNLATTASFGFRNQTQPGVTAVLLGRTDEPTLSLAATALGKLALAAGRPLAIDVVPSLDRAAGVNTLAFGTVGTLPPETTADIDYTLPQASATAERATGGADAQAWNDKVSSSLVGSAFAGAARWAKNTFNLDLAAFSIWPGRQAPLRLPETAGLFVSQSVNPATKTLHTTIAAPTEASLETGIAAIGDQRNWDAIDGRASFLDMSKDRMESAPAAGRTVLALEVASFSNLRLVLTNWLSGNFTVYAMAMIVAATLLGLSTHALLSKLGRRNDD